MPRVLRGILIAVGLFFIWQLIVWISQAPHFILPGPMRVAEVLWERQSLIFEQAQVTFIEIVLGMILGCVMGFLSALLLQAVKPIQPWLLPVLILSQAIPVFALAPILMVWFGYGMLSKVIMASLIIYFPVASACYDGLRQTPADWIDLSRTMQASSWRQLWFIRLPAALPALASGLRVAVTIAPIGAVVGEWVGSSAGLGYMMLQANGRMQTDLMFACLLVLALMAVTLYFTLDAVLRRYIRW